MSEAAVNIKAAQQSLTELCVQLGLVQPPQPWILVNIAEQCLHLVGVDGGALLSYPISSAKKGVGNQQGSLQTPLGLHCIAEKIGGGSSAGEVFKGRQSTAECAVIETRPQATGLDCITSRILWLQGLQPGVNQGGEVDSYKRYIYIHGTHEEGLIGRPASIGCIRLCNQDVIDLYAQVYEDSWVYILE